MEMTVHKLGLQKIIIFVNFLFVFSLVLDPRNVFGLKFITFILILLLSLPYLDFSYFIIIDIFLSINFLSYAFGILTNQNIDLDMANFLTKAYLFLFYLFVVSNAWMHTFRFFYYATLCQSIIVTVIYIIIQIFPVLTTPLSLFGGQNFFFFAPRHFYKFQYFQVFYVSSYLCTIGYAYSVYNLFFKSKFRYFIEFLLFFCGLLFSGTRANILSALLIFLVGIIFYLYHHKKLLSTVFFCSFSVMSGLFLIFKLLSEKGDVSIDIKSGHMKSMFMLFSESPLKFLLIGNGPGSRFYTSSLRTEVSLTELSYLDLIRNYGLISTIIICLLYLYPLLLLYNAKQYSAEFKFILGMGYVAFLFIAGTNPFLINSSGFMMLCIMIYISKVNVKREMNDITSAI
jgi:hypothetical protein